MKIKYLLPILFFPAFSLAQTTRGIHFKNFQNWRQVFADSKSSGKYIFIDFYATWCLPCKRMDNDIYPLARVGDAANANYISLKIQQDKAASDNDQIKDWYHEADSLCRLFEITKLPTLLFLAPDGKLLAKIEGYIDPDSLITVFNKTLTVKTPKLGKNESPNNEQYFYESLKNLAEEGKDLGHIEIADSIAEVYFRGYLKGARDSDSFNKNNIKFISDFPQLLCSSDRFFKFFWNTPDIADQLIGDGHSNEIIKYVVRKEEVTPLLFVGGQPVANKSTWEEIREIVRQKFGNKVAADLTSLAEQISYYHNAKKWNDYAQLINRAIEKYPPQINGHIFANATMVGIVFQRDDWNLNSSAWDVFLHCNDIDVLEYALNWSNVSIEKSGNENDMNALDQYYDTKANILYKLRRTKEAIRAERRAYQIAWQAAKKRGQKGGEVYLETINKMKKAVPTWPQSTENTLQIAKQK